MRNRYYHICYTTNRQFGCLAKAVALFGWHDTDKLYRQRKALPQAEIFAIRVFDHGLTTYPSQVARGILRAAAQGTLLHAY
jgi:hypothetical protein